VVRLEAEAAETPELISVVASRVPPPAARDTRTGTRAHERPARGDQLADRAISGVGSGQTLV